MPTYKELREKHQKEIDEFPMILAFSERQFEQGMRKLGLEPHETDKIYMFGSVGGFYRREDAPKLQEMLDRHEKEIEKAIKADRTGKGFIFDMFNYELSNHDYCVSKDIQPALKALGLSAEDISKDEKLAHGLELALEEQNRIEELNREMPSKIMSRYRH